MKEYTKHLKLLLFYCFFLQNINQPGRMVIFLQFCFYSFSSCFHSSFVFIPLALLFHQFSKCQVKQIKELWAFLRQSEGRVGTTGTNLLFEVIILFILEARQPHLQRYENRGIKETPWVWGLWTLTELFRL